MLNERIKTLRAEKGITQVELARVIGMGGQSSTLGMWELGRSTPSVPHLIRLADYFGVTLDYLLGRSAERTQVMISPFEKQLAPHLRGYYLDTVKLLTNTFQGRFALGNAPDTNLRLFTLLADAIVKYLAESPFDKSGFDMMLNESEGGKESGNWQESEWITDVLNSFEHDVLNEIRHIFTINIIYNYHKRKEDWLQNNDDIDVYDDEQADIQTHERIDKRNPYETDR